MIKVTRNDSIDLIPMSVRLRNCLHRKGLHTLGAVADFNSTEDWLTIHNMGAKTAQEVCELVASLCFVETEEPLQCDKATLCGQSDKRHAAAPKWQIQDVLLTDILLPNRALNVFATAGIDRVVQLLALSEADLLSMDSMGKTTVRATLMAVDQFVERCCTDKTLDPVQQDLVHRAIDLADYLDCSRSWCIHEFLQVSSAYPTLFCLSCMNRRASGSIHS